MSDMITGPSDEYEELEAIADSNGGRVTAELVLERAANPTSTFHKHFTWDDTEAARRYRMQQAGGLIRKFTLVQQNGDRTIRVPAFVKINDGEDGYGRARDVVTMEAIRDQRKLKLMASLDRLADELRHWDEFTELADAIAEALAP